MRTSKDILNEMDDYTDDILCVFEGKDERLELLGDLITNPEDSFMECNIYKHSFKDVASSIIKANLLESGEFEDKDVANYMKSKPGKAMIKDLMKLLGWL